jgi:hypothetical protein
MFGLEIRLPPAALNDDVAVLLPGAWLQGKVPDALT